MPSITTGNIPPAASAISLNVPVPGQVNVDMANLWNATKRQYQACQGYLNLLSSTVFNRTDGQTAQQAVTALGTTAASVLQIATLIAVVLTGITGAPVVAIPATWNVTYNPDGTVTLLAVQQQQQA